MAAKRDFDGRCEPTQFPSAWTSGNKKGGFRDIVLRSDFLQHLIRQISFQRHYARLVAFKCLARECINLNKWDCHRFGLQFGR